MKNKKSPPAQKTKIFRIYETLYSAFGPQGWWPGEGALEITLGAILTQNTTWKNTEKAIANLKSAGIIRNGVGAKPAIRKLNAMPTERLARLIKSSGYFNAKAKKLKNFARFAKERAGGDLNAWYKTDAKKLRAELLAVSGIGAETADSIILYAAEKPSFVIDAYTRRILLRHNFKTALRPYDELRAFIEERIPKSVKIYNEFHALFVKVGKDFCKKRNPRCAICPLSNIKPINPDACD